MPLETSFEPVGPHLQGDDSENQLNHQMPIRGHRLHRYGSQMEHYAHLALLNRPDYSQLEQAHQSALPK